MKQKEKKSNTDINRNQSDIQGQIATFFFQIIPKLLFFKKKREILNRSNEQASGLFDNPVNEEE